MAIEDDACLCFIASDAIQPGRVLIVLMLFRLSLCQDGPKEVLELQKTAPFTPNLSIMKREDSNLFSLTGGAS